MPASIETTKESLASLTGQVRAEEEKIALGGGPEAIQRQHEKGRLTARQRIAQLIDQGSELFEVGRWVGWGMYSQWGGCPSGGVVCGVGQVAGHKI